MSKGYRIVVPERLNPLLSDSKYDEFAVAILHWLIPELYDQLKDELAEVEIEVIRVEYMGAYPALGLHYEPVIPFESQIEELVEATIDKLLQEKPVTELVHFITANNTHWGDVTNKLMTKS